MAETTMIMDETGRVYVHSSDSDSKEESVDGPPPEGDSSGGEHSGLESSPANKKSGNMDSKQQATVADKQIGGPSGYGVVNDLLQKCNNNIPKKDQLYPMRSELGEKDSRLVDRLSHGQVDLEATAEDEGQSNLLQENAKGHITQSSIPNYEQSGTAKPMMKRDEAQAKNTEIACCAESMAQAAHKDACSQSVNIKSDLAEHCPERSPCLENQALKQRSELLTAPEHAIAAQSLTEVKLDNKSPSLRPHVLMEHVQNTEKQQEDKKILQGGHEKNTTEPFAEVPDQLKGAETTLTHTGHQHVDDNPPLESQAHHKRDVDAKATKTEDVSDVAAKKDKSINDAPNQRPESLTALEHGITGQHHTGLTLDKPSCGGKSVPLEQHIQNVPEKQFCDTETQASEEFFQKEPSKPFKSKLLSKQVIVSAEVQHKTPVLVGAACTVKAEQLNEDKTSALTEHIQNTEQHKENKTLENANECSGKNTVLPDVDVPSQLKSAETTQTKTGHQLTENDPPLDINVHQKKSVDGATQTNNFSQETLPSDVSHEQLEQSTSPEQPYYAEPPGHEHQEPLYLEPDDIELREDPCVRQQVARLDHVTLNIAITGMTGAGKSTFINAVRGVDNDDENAAPTGATETTMAACAYPHPTMPNVRLWDLPGTGSPKFKAKKYLKEVKLETYDFFIIISSERFKENDLMLAKEILKKNKKFYFLRSKIDNDVRAEQFKKNFNVDKLIACIREDLTSCLKSIVKPTVFLVSSFDLDKYDFPILVDTLIADLPEHKREALILSLPIYSTQMLERKIKSFEKTAQKAAKAASGISMAPIPGLSVACDAGILLAFFSKCYHALGLDDQSLDKLSERVNNNSLKALRESRPLVVAIRNNELSGRELSSLGSKRSALEFAYSLVPVWGSKKAASSSHNATLGLLEEGLKELADTAREVLKVAKIDHIKEL